MNEIKCECGHVNPEGTVLCEACGKPIEKNQHIDGNDKRKLLNMRYDGSARRSQTYNKSFVDKIWSFFSSVKVGVWLIVIALVASAIGTIFPQEEYIPAEAVSRDPAVYYESTFGLFGKIYYQLGFYHLYSSWWYMILIALIGISLVICSIDRFVPLYKALKRQKAKRHETFLNRQRLYSETEEVTTEEKEKIKNALKQQRYKVREENGHILAEKGRFSRWGPYVNHIGLIIILLAAILRMTPLLYLDDYVWVREGQQTVIPSTDGEYYIKNNDFILETYDENDSEGRFKEAIDQEGMVAKNYQTNAVIYKKKETSVAGADPELEKVTDGEIRMNQPLKFDGYTLYQAGYQLNEFSSMSFNIESLVEFKNLQFNLNKITDDDKTGDTLDSFTIDLNSPKNEYELDNGFRVVVNQFYPDYYLDNGEPKSDSDVPRNPAFVFFVYPPDSDDPEVSFVGLGRNIDATGENQYQLAIDDFELRNEDALDDNNNGLGTFTIDLDSPKPEYKLDNGTRVVVEQYYPEYYSDNGEPRSKSKYPRNPAFELSIYAPGSDQAETSFVGVGENNPMTKGNQYKLGLADYELRDVSGITVRKDYTLPFFILGAIIFMIGVIQGMYWHHRRIWIHPKDNGLLVAAHTNKNWFGIKKDIEKVIEGTNVNMVVDQQELED
ncbi:cytochrome c biogenesis protein ResB [Lentibacillus sp. Marseille-P4043]|uniref:cytochrome c biogenesis protein ResB n=1 Tax=Lentibacillus sp. Marseille-P4043 TaxID=2040293 RepID=UPI001F41121E|nr:cytochrome c biogenesis protein ResB [Lentibacillus sp. Marseille-P4043]